jgi:general secretion pathway protein D
VKNITIEAIQVKSHLFAVVLSMAISACATTTDPTFETGKLMIEKGRVEEGLQQLNAAAKAHPQNLEYRSYYVRARYQYGNQLLTQGDKLRLLGKPEDAAVLYQRVLALDAGNTRAQEGMAAVQAELRHRRTVAEAKTLLDAGDVEGARVRLRQILAENPRQSDARALIRVIEDQRAKTMSTDKVLRTSLHKPVTLEFREALLKTVFEVLSRTSGINFVFDRDVRPDLRTTIIVRNASIENAIRYLLTTNQLEMRVIDDNTILVYPNLPNKIKDYQELTVKTFYLANADVKQTLNMVKTVVKTRDVFIDERLNMLTMRDTPDAIRMAEKLIAAQDLAEPEVMLEVEVLEIARSRLTEIGIRYPTQITAGLTGAGGPGNVTLNETKGSLGNLTHFTITDPAVVLNLLQADGDTNLLANPRIRVKNREKAKIHIGDKLPVITTTSTANVGVSESVTYLDVGLKLDVEPNVFLEDEVGIKVGLEVSNIVQQITSANGTLTYRLGTRNTVTALRLKNGETQVLAGLLQDEERNTADKIPGLGDLPTIGRLFGSHRDEHNKTEIILLITPYVVRNIERPDSGVIEFASGTDSSIGGTSLGFRSTDSGVTRPNALAVPTAPPLRPTETPGNPQPTLQPSGGTTEERR